MAAGLSDSMIKVWSLTPNRLKKMKCASELSQIDKDAGLSHAKYTLNWSI